MHTNGLAEYQAQHKSPPRVTATVSSKCVSFSLIFFLISSGQFHFSWSFFSANSLLVKTVFISVMFLHHKNFKRIFLRKTAIYSGGVIPLVEKTILARKEIFSSGSILTGMPSLGEWVLFLRSSWLHYVVSERSFSASPLSILIRNVGNFKIVSFLSPTPDQSTENLWVWVTAMTMKNKNKTPQLILTGREGEEPLISTNVSQNVVYWQ